MNLEEFKNFLPEYKKKSDPIFCRFIYRPISIYFAWILFKIGISANIVSLTSIFLTSIACIFLVSGNFVNALISSILFFIVAISDCVDGNIARASKKNSLKGEWLDAFSGYFVYAFQPLSIGLYLEKNDNVSLFIGFWILCGSLISILNLLSRLIYQKSNNLLIQSKSIDQNLNYKKSFSLGNEIGLVGFMMPLLLLSIIISKLEYYLFFYFLVYIFSFIFTFLRIYIKTFKF